MEAQIIHNTKDHERSLKLMAELARHRFPARIWEAKMREPARAGITWSHKNIIWYAREWEWEEVLIMEDDVYFPSRDGYKNFLAMYENRSEDSDIYLGGIYMGRESLSENKQHIKKFSGLHCYVVRQKFYDTFLQIDDTQSLDNSLSALAQVGVCKIMCCYPMMAIQHENVSSTSGCIFRHKDYFTEEMVYGLKF